MATPNTFVAATAVAVRALETPGADWTNGVNAASCSPGAGVSLAGEINLTGAANSWTLLDQDEVARTPQVSQPIGGEGLTTSADWPLSGGLSGKGTEPIIGGTNDSPYDPETSGEFTATGDATLSTLAAGWVVTP